jgi:uncharacterized protein (DUF697 family)
MPKSSKTTINANPLKNIKPAPAKKRLSSGGALSGSSAKEVKQRRSTNSNVDLIKSSKKPSLTTNSSRQGKEKMENQDMSVNSKLKPKEISADQVFEAEVNGSGAGKSDENTLVIDYRHKLADATIVNASQWATAAGFITVPGIDTLTISGIQLKMVYDLCKIYKVPFKKKAILAVAGAALGGSLTTTASFSLASFGLSKIPYIGSILSIATQPAISFASTYALGMLFIKHFESNGNLLDFDLDSTKAIFDEQFEKAKVLYKSQLKSAKATYFEQVERAKKIMNKNLGKPVDQEVAASA